MRPLVALLPLVVMFSCGGPKQPCTESGEAWLDIPQSRVAAVAEVRTEGVCEALKPEGGCSLGTCVEGQDGQQHRLITVRGLSQGSCTVTVMFNDDCPNATLDYKFGGPLDNCCADVCFRPAMSSYAINACAAAK